MLLYYIYVIIFDVDLISRRREEQHTEREYWWREVPQGAGGTRDATRVNRLRHIFFSMSLSGAVAMVTREFPVTLT